eukprot:CAMPEP_0177787070 /NCGR_PEP_ID=MMETSP0491_2-20121128/21271_1 /TAXON_ID=63592 /ORGANISM="Tetraselmis chuii, Strain PLY429" /LENGTH=73 /DNA_ID=CAMNT_0019308345 /DNA_START=261 /DNA_END=482 /DNA_ORIENTATION=-
MLSDTSRHHEISNSWSESAQQRVSAVQVRRPTELTWPTDKLHSLPLEATAAMPASVSLALDAGVCQLSAPLYV